MTTSFPFEPVAFSLGTLDVRWYSLAILVGLLAVWQQIQSLARQHHTQTVAAMFSGVQLGRLVAWCFAMLMVSARLGYALLYDPQLLWSPIGLMSLWHGGFSFHGGLVGVALGCYFYSRRYALPMPVVSDLISAAAPLALLAGRLGNFLNNELVGRPSALPWAMVFPGYGGVARHPSQLYEAALEGMLLFIVLRVLINRNALVRRPGLVSGVFLIGYALVRAFCDIFREFDPHILGDARHLPLSWWLAFPMAAAGTCFLATSRRPALPFMPRAGTPRPAEVSALISAGAVAALIISGCSKKKVPEYDNLPSAMVRNGVVNSEPRCDCQGAQGVYASHTATKPASVSWMALVEDLNSHAKTRVYDTTPAINPGAEHFIGCTRYQLATSCRSAAAYSALQVSATAPAFVATTTRSARNAPMGFAQIAGQSCQTLCTGATTGKCLALGTRYYAAVGPIAGMLDQFPRNPDGSLKNGSFSKAQFMSRYNVDPKRDQCGRGAIEIKDNVIANTGSTTYCSVQSEDLPLTVVRRAMRVLEPRFKAGTITMYNGIPREMEAKPLGGAATSTSLPVIGFEMASKAPMVTFDGKNGAAFTKAFGGSVIAATRKLGSPNMTVLSTANGCISIDEP